MPDQDLSASCWTTAGDAAPPRGDERSPLPLRARLEAAAGFCEVGLEFLPWSNSRTVHDACGWCGKLAMAADRPVVALGQVDPALVAGVDLVDLEAASARGITVAVTPGSGTRAVAEGVLALALHQEPCCMVEDGLEADLIAEACGLSPREHRPVRIEEVRP